MSPTRTLKGRLAGATVIAALVALATASAASAATSGTVTVSGESKSKIVLTIADTTAEFGTNLTPDGVTSNSGDAGVDANVDGSDPSDGACYEWPGSVTVRSNVGYYVTVGAAAPSTRIDFLTTDPGTYAACTSGEPLAVSMYTTAAPAGSWVSGQGVTSKRSHSFWLGLDVRWTDDPGASFASGSLTLTASATP